MTDSELILGLEKDPENGFAAIYQRYSGPLFRFIYRFTGTQETAEEILHDVFSELIASKFRLSEDGTLKSWLYTLAKNKSLNFSKKNSREVINNEIVQAAEDKSDFENQSVAQDLLNLLTATENILPADLLETWKLKKQGFDHQAIGKELSIPVGTVKSRIHRIVEILRKEMV